MLEVAMSCDGIETLALGGGCHWCTEVVFQTVRGVRRVDQGWITTPAADGESEGVRIHFDSALVGLDDLVRVHLHTHASMSEHSMRDRYRSALYSRTEREAARLALVLESLAGEMPRPVITRVLPFGAFRESREAIRNYYCTDPGRPFCVAYIEPKLDTVRSRFPGLVSGEEITDGR